MEKVQIPAGYFCIFDISSNMNSFSVSVNRTHYANEQVYMRYVDKHETNSQSDYNSEKKMYVDNDYLMNYKSFLGGAAVSINSATKFKVAYINLKNRDSVI